MKKTAKIALVSTLVAGVAILLVYAKPLANAQVRRALMSMGSPAEDMLDAIDSKDTHQLKSLYHKLKIGMEKTNNLPTKNNTQDKQVAMLNSWFELISLEMKEADDFPALANAINQFSGQLIITTKFDYAYQKDIAWMDYLGRELLLLNKYPSKSLDHEALLRVRKTELNKTWESIKFQLNEQGGRTLVKKVDPAIQSMLEESDPGKLVALSMKELDLVDDIESFFHID